jgi:hypothetical protein
VAHSARSAPKTSYDTEEQARIPYAAYGQWDIHAVILGTSTSHLARRRLPWYRSEIIDKPGRDRELHPIGSIYG